MTPRINPKFARFRLRVERSSIDRRGVFALEDIPRGKTVIEYTGKRLTLAQADSLGPPKDAYLAVLGNGWVADPSVGGSGAEFINHSCSPNLRWRRVRGRLFYSSRRRIRAGEELLGNYGYPIKLRRIPCRCGSPKCKGTFRYLLS
jgi:SET domain-containing protein